MRIDEVMTPDVRAVAPDRTVRDAARLMDELNVGVLPVCDDDGRLVGIVTDRDITVRSTATGALPGEQQVQEIMTLDPTICSPDEDTGEVLARMSALQVRRIPVVADGRLVGIVSLGDLAEDGALGAEDALRRISAPAEPDRSGTLSTVRADATRDDRPSPLSNQERRELESRLSQPDAPRADRGRAPDPDDTPDISNTGGLVFNDEDNVRAAFGLSGSPAAGEGTGTMRGGMGGEGYTNYGQNFGPGAQQPPPTPLTDAGDLGRPDQGLDETESGAPSTSPGAVTDDGRAGRVVFSSGSHDPGTGEGIAGEPERGVDTAAASDNTGTSGGPAGSAAGSSSAGRTRSR